MKLIVVKTNLENSNFCSQEYKSIKNKVNDLWNVGRFITFEDGMDNQFTDKLDELIDTENLNLLSKAIAEMVEKNNSSDVVTFFALKKIGSLWNPNIKNFQLEVLNIAIKSQNRLIKEGAVQGLDLLGKQE